MRHVQLLLAVCAVLCGSASAAESVQKQGEGSVQSSSTPLVKDYNAQSTESRKDSGIVRKVRTWKKPKDARTAGEQDDCNRGHAKSKRSCTIH